MVDFCNHIDSESKYYIYGTNVFGKFCCEKISKTYGDGSILGFVETNPRVQEFYGKKLYAPSEALAAGPAKFIVASFTQSADIISVLSKLGVCENDILVFDEYKNFFKTITANEGFVVSSICVWPPLEEENKDFTEKLGWFIPDRINIVLWCKNEEAAKHFNKNVRIASDDEVNEVFGSSDYIYLLDQSRFREIPETFRQKIRIADPHFFSTVETNNYAKLFYNSFSDEYKKSELENSIRKFEKMKEEYSSYDTANILCTGPSIEEIYESDYDFSGSFNIICNSMVKDKEMLKRIKPSLLTFTDINFYFSPNEYSRQFHKDMISAFEEYRFYIIIFEEHVPLLKYHFPMIEDHLIGIPMHNAKNKVVFPDADDFRVINTSNICTQVMLPMASSVCSNINIIGCTGRNPDETYYWKHNGKTQYLDLIHCVMEAYPSVFSGQKYDVYYDSHCEYLKQILEYGESLGKKYVNMTTSFIPALKERTYKK